MSDTSTKVPSVLRRRVRRFLRRRNLSRTDVAIRTGALLIALVCFGFGIFVALHGPAA